MILLNEYFSGKVKSLGHELDGQPFTVGIIEPGDYSFSTSTKEEMEIVFGEMEVSLPDGKRQIFRKGQNFSVPAQVEFSVQVKAPVSYICLYK